MNRPVSIAYPAFFDDADQKTASLTSSLYRRAYPVLRNSLSHLIGTPASGGHMRMVRQAVGSIGNAGVGMAGGQMLDRMTGGDGTTGAVVGSLAGLSPYFGGARGRRLMSAMAPRVLAAQALDSVQRARMGYSSLDPNSVKQHMQTQMANEIQPILEPWQKLLSEQQAKPPMTTNSQLIRQMQGAQQKIPGFFG